MLINYFSDLIYVRFGSTKLVAAYISSLSEFLPMFLPFFIGILMDKKGERVKLIFFTIIAAAVSLFALCFSSINPIIPVLLLSLSISTGPLSLLSSIPLILPQDVLGIANGLFKSGANIMGVIQDIMVGMIQDKWNDYDYSIVFLLFMSSLALLLGFVLNFINKKHWNGLLNYNLEERMASSHFEDKMNDKVNYFPLSVLIILLILSWILFLLAFFNKK